jgi:hypothetical protein
VRCQRAGPLLHRSDGSGPPRRLWPYPCGQVAQGTGLPGSDHAQDACRCPGVEYAGDLGVPPTPLRQWGSAQDRSGRAAEQAHSCSVHRNGSSCTVAGCGRIARVPTGADRARGPLCRRCRSRTGLPSAVAARGSRHRPPPDAPRICGSPPAAWRWLSHLVPHPASSAAGSRPGFGPRRPGAPASGRVGRERGAPGPAGADCEPGACLSAVVGRGERARVDRCRCAARGRSVRRRRLRAELPRAGHLGVRAWAPRTERRHVRAPLVARPGPTRRRSSAGGRRLTRGASLVARGRLPRGASSVACRGCLCRPLPVANRRLPCRLPRGRLSRCAPPPCEPPL